MVRIEDVELSLVGNERAGVIAFRGFAGVSHAGHFAGGANLEFLDGGDQTLAVVGELLNRLDLGGVDHDRHQVGLGHLFLKELDGRLLGADLVVGLHGGEVEEQGHQAAILISDRAMRGRNGRLRFGGIADDQSPRLICELGEQL